MISLAKPASAWKRFRETLEGAKTPVHADPEHRIRLAAAVLMVEIARADTEHDDAERQTLVQQLMARFELDADESAELIASAERSADKAISLYEYLDALNAGMDRGQKQAVLRMLWKVAYADKRLDPHEEHLLRKISDLLHLDHADFIRTKLQVLDAT